MSQQDYYKTLGVTPDSSIDDIKKAYRKLALETHPDRNPGDPRAEERFKRISEAYGVLIDPQKKAQYDDFRRFGGGFHPGSGGARQGGFGYTQEEIFRDFFNSRHAQDAFSEMQKEFQRMGFRFDDTFFNRLFFGDKTIFFHGMFFGGPGGARVFRYGNKPGSGPYARPEEGNGGARPVENKPRGLLEHGASLLAKAGKKIGSYILGKVMGESDPRGHVPMSGRTAAINSDIVYDLPITRALSASGATVEVELPHWGDGKRVSVRIPPGARSGTKLRLKGMGHPIANSSGERGDLYLQLRVS